jgi:hypothetical protein
MAGDLLHSTLALVQLDTPLTLFVLAKQFR